MKTKVTARTENANDESAKVDVIKLGVDLHAAKAVVTAQLDGCPPQPPQKIGTEGYFAWVRQLKQNHPQAKI